MYNKNHASHNDITAEILNDYLEGKQQASLNCEEVTSSVQDLLTLSDKLQEAFALATPRKQFTAELKAKLQRDHVASLIARRQNNQKATNMMGTILSLLTITALVAQLVGGAILLITFFNKRHRPRLNSTS